MQQTYRYPSPNGTIAIISTCTNHNYPQKFPPVPSGKLTSRKPTEYEGQGCNPQGSTVRVIKCFFTTGSTYIIRPGSRENLYSMFLRLGEFTSQKTWSGDLTFAVSGQPQNLAQITCHMNWSERQGFERETDSPLFLCTIALVLLIDCGRLLEKIPSAQKTPGTRSHR